MTDTELPKTANVLGLWVQFELWRKQAEELLEQIELTHYNLHGEPSATEASIRDKLRQATITLGKMQELLGPEKEATRTIVS